MTDIKDLIAVHNQLWDQKMFTVAERKGYDISPTIMERYHVALQFTLLISPTKEPVIFEWISYAKKQRSG